MTKPSQTTTSIRMNPTLDAKIYAYWRKHPSRDPGWIALHFKVTKAKVMRAVEKGVQRA